MAPAGIVHYIGAGKSSGAGIDTAAARDFPGTSDRCGSVSKEYDKSENNKK